jgi:pyruvate,water dikinase
MSFVRPLWDIRPEDLGETGGKAVGLSRLADLGVEVPSGFVATASFFQEIRSRFPLEPDAETLAEKIPEELRAQLESALESLGPSRSGFAVRSSCADEDAEKASFAGIHESYLNVSRSEVPRNLFRCWSSAFTPRALAYRQRMGVPTATSSIRMAVVVQRMLRPSCAGVLFTREPGGPGDSVLIQAVEGTAEKLVQGTATPATLKVPREEGAAIDGAGGGFPLAADQVRELLSLALRLEAAWGHPLDLEWAEEAGQLYFLQARPITSRAKVEATEAESGIPGVDDILWTRANLRELLPDLPSPLFGSLTERIDWAENSRRLGMSVLPGDRVVRFIQGRPYFNLSLIARWMGEFGIPMAHFTRALGHDLEPTGSLQAPARPVAAFLRSPAKMLRLGLLQASTPRRLRRFFQRARSEAERLSRLNLEERTDAGLVEIFQDSSRYSTEFIFHLQLAFNRVSGILLVVDALIPAKLDREAFLGAVLAAGEKSVSMKQGMDLIRLSLHARSDPRISKYLREARGDFGGFHQALHGTEFAEKFRDYLAEYGHRGVHESDPAMPVYSEDPGFLLRTLATLVSDPDPPDPEATLRRQEETAQKAWIDLRRQMTPLGRAMGLRVALLRAAVAALKEAIAQRERTRFEGMRVSAALRRFLREAGERLMRRGCLTGHQDMPLLRIEEIEGALLGRLSPESVREVVRSRRAEQERQRELPMPNLLRESEIARVSLRAPGATREAGEFQGMPVGPGRVEGRVVVLESPDQIDRVIHGDILVTPTLDPSWIPLFTVAAGLVVEMGGTLSHGSIIAREYGLPAVVNIPGITRILQTGNRVMLDGSTGKLRRLS